MSGLGQYHQGRGLMFVTAVDVCIIFVDEKLNDINIAFTCGIVQSLQPIVVSLDHVVIALAHFLHLTQNPNDQRSAAYSCSVN